MRTKLSYNSLHLIRAGNTDLIEFISFLKGVLVKYFGYNGSFIFKAKVRNIFQVKDDSGIGFIWTAKMHLFIHVSQMYSKSSSGQFYFASSRVKLHVCIEN